MVDDGYNIDDDGTCGLTATTSLSDTPAGLDPSGLQNNGGPTQTILPATGSPAIGAIPTGTTLNGVQVCPRTDQRGVASVGNCTIGAVEVPLCASGLTPHVLNTTYPNGSFTGLFCVNAKGIGTYTQGTVSGSGSVTTFRGTTFVGALGKNLLLGGSDQRHQEWVRRVGSGESDRDVHLELSLLRRATGPRLWPGACARGDVRNQEHMSNVGQNL